MKKWINIAGIGDLYVEQILYEFEFPILFVCIDNNQNRYLSLTIDEMLGQYVIVPISCEMLHKILRNQIYIEQAFRNCSQNIVYITDYNFDEKKLIVRIELPEDVSEDLLPDKNTYLDMDMNNSELKKYDDKILGLFINQNTNMAKHLVLQNKVWNYHCDIRFNENINIEKEKSNNKFDSAFTFFYSKSNQLNI